MIKKNLHALYFRNKAAGVQLWQDSRRYALVLKWKTLLIFPSITKLWTLYQGKTTHSHKCFINSNIIFILYPYNILMWCLHLLRPSIQWLQNCVPIINNGSTKSMIRHYLINNCQFQWHIKTTFLTNLITTLPKVHKFNSNYWTYREQKHTHSQISTLTLKFQHM